MKIFSIPLLFLLTGCQACGWSTACGKQTWSPGHFFGSHFASHKGCVSETGCQSETLHKHCKNSRLSAITNSKWVIKHSAKQLAMKDFPPDCHCSDFKAGFQQAYIDVSMGANGQVPAVAPEKYWKPSGRTAGGHVQAQRWFEGYTAGAQSALSYTDRFLDVATSTPYGHGPIFEADVPPYH